MIITDFTWLASHVHTPEEFAILHYTFYTNRCGILVEKTNTLQLFPFVNMEFTTAVHPRFQGSAETPQECSMQSYYHAKAVAQRDMNEFTCPGFLKDSQRWWYNNQLVCNVVPQDLWSDRGNAVLYEMLSLAWKDVQGPRSWILNKRDSPLLKKDGMLPYGGPIPFLFQRPMNAPLSFYGGKAWNDILIPPPEAWNTYTLNTRKLKYKTAQIVFRGTSTGKGNSIETNIRLKVCTIQDPRLDAGITKFNKRDRIQDNRITFQDIQILENLVKQKRSLLPSQQSDYKYILHLDGNQASSRLIWSIQSGSLLFIPESQAGAPDMWIKLPTDCYVPLKPDASDMFEKFEYFEAHPQEAQEIVDRMMTFSKSVLGKDNIIRYLQSI